MAADTEEFKQRQKEMNRRILDRVATDPAFKEQLIEEPEKALVEMGLEAELAEFRSAMDNVEIPEPEVQAHHHLRTRWYCLSFWTGYWKKLYG